MTISGAADMWRDRIEDAVRRAAGEEWARETADAWRRHARRDLVEVTVYGPYDAGKSSLIKRLLVEDGTPIPEWLTISARRETFEMNEVASGGLCFTDAPGIATGNPLHDAVADDALALTDALLLVLPPQLLAGEAARLRSVVDGSYFGLDRLAAHPAGSLILVVAQAETAGIDPMENREGFHDLCERKRRELLAALAAGDDVEHRASVHVIAADPYGLVAGSPEAGREAYDLGREWDGIEELRNALQQLPSRLHELREAAMYRYWSWIATRAQEAVAVELERLAATVDEGERALAQLAGLREELQAVDAAATEELRALVHDELRSIADSMPETSPDAVRAEAERRLVTVHDAWSAKYRRELERLARGAELEFDLRAARAGTLAAGDHLADLLLSAPAAPEPGPGSDRIRGIRETLERNMKGVARAGYETRIGMSLGDAQAELKRVQGFNSNQLAEYFERRTGFASADEVSRVRRELAEARAVEQLLPSIIELGSLGWTEYEQRRLEQEERDRRQRLRGQIETAAEQIADKMIRGSGPEEPSGWASAVESLGAALRSSEVRDALLDASRERLRTLSKVSAELTALIEESALAA